MQSDKRTRGFFTAFMWMLRSRKSNSKCNFCHGTGWGDRYYCDFYGWTRLRCDKCNPKESEATDAE